MNYFRDTPAPASDATPDAAAGRRALVRLRSAVPRTRPPQIARPSPGQSARRTPMQSWFHETPGRGRTRGPLGKRRNDPPFALLRAERNVPASPTATVPSYRALGAEENECA